MHGCHAARLGLLLLLAACKPAAFASQETDLMRTPPPLLPVDANAFWNDRARGVYGEFSVGPGLYRSSSGVCRSARVTAISEATRSTEDRTLLYCAGADGAFTLDPALSCRSTATASGLACRNQAGDAVMLPPA